MKEGKIDGAITMLFGDDGLRIELFDNDSFKVFAEIKMTPEQVTKAFGRLSNVPCELRVSGLDKVGLKMENKTFEFELPKDFQRNFRSESESELDAIATKLLETEGGGWVADKYYGSQNSFFIKDGKKYARVTIRRWV